MSSAVCFAQKWECRLTKNVFCVPVRLTEKFTKEPKGEPVVCAVVMPGGVLDDEAVDDESLNDLQEQRFDSVASRTAESQRVSEFADSHLE
jgi:hypothetical protein